MFNLDSFVLVYNRKQNQFHTETVRHMLADNRKIFRGDVDSPWRTLEIANTEEEIMLLRAEAEASNPRKGLQSFPLPE